MISNDLLRELLQLRHELHANPELSGQERSTSQRLKSFLRDSTSARWIEFSGTNGFALVFEGKQEGPSVLLRADMDALPIQELNCFEHRSKQKGVSHKCGHDGHATILAGVARQLSQNPVSRGKVILLFQPAEETGEGAEQMMESKEFKDLSYDYAFALHNYPGLPMGSVWTRKGSMTAASSGVIIRLTGKTSHAAEPEQGISPLKAMTGLLNWLVELPQSFSFDDFVLVTPVHAQLGEEAFGTSPGEAVVMATIRSYSNKDMQCLRNLIELEVEKKASEFGLASFIEYTESFMATVNDPGSIDFIKEAAGKVHLSYDELKSPFRWSEDFSCFLQEKPGALFVLGAGEDHPKLHNPDYDFPDELIERGVDVFMSLIEAVTKEDLN
jgi:amidohydrolase